MAVTPSAFGALTLAPGHMVDILGTKVACLAVNDGKGVATDCYLANHASVIPGTYGIAHTDQGGAWVTRVNKSGKSSTNVWARVKARARATTPKYYTATVEDSFL